MRVDSVRSLPMFIGKGGTESADLMSGTGQDRMGYWAERDRSETRGMGFCADCVCTKWARALFNLLSRVL